MLHEFELGLNATEATKNICGAKGEGAFNRRTVTRWFKKFQSGCKNFDNQKGPDRTKIVDSETVLQTIGTNRRVTGEFATSYN